MRHPKFLAFAQLLRLPNVFTAFADIAMAGAATGLVDSALIEEVLEETRAQASNAVPDARSAAH